MTIICLKCGFQNPEEVKICQNCKNSLSRKKNMWKIGFFIQLILLVLLGGIIIKLVKDRLSTVVSQTSQPTLQDSYPQIASWKTYSNPKLGVVFQYPDNWVLFNEPGQEEGSVDPRISVTYVDDKCRKNPDLVRWASDNKCQYYSFYIERSNYFNGQSLSDENANLYVLKFTLEDEKRLDRCMRDTNTSCWGERSIPGIEYLGKEERLFSKQTLFPAALINTMPRIQGSHQYYIINNKRLYLIELAAPDYKSGGNNPSFTDENHPIIKIIKTLKFL